MKFLTRFYRHSRLFSVLPIRLLWYVYPISDQISQVSDFFKAVVLAVAGCGGNARAIPLRVGRTDAVQAGPSGVPGPFTPLQPTLAQFAKAGFSATETIALV